MDLFFELVKSECVIRERKKIFKLWQIPNQFEARFVVAYG